MSGGGGTSCPSYAAISGVWREWWWWWQRGQEVFHHAREGNGLAVAGANLVFVGLGRLQGMLEEGVLIVASFYDRLVIRGRSRAPGGTSSMASSLTTW
jgi:hypothetical protein